MVTGLESGYGTRPIDRDLLTTTPSIPPLASSDASHIFYNTDDATAPGSREITRPPSVIPSPSQLKDSDGDDVMSPPPHDTEDDPIAPTLSQAITMTEAPELTKDEDMLQLDPAAETSPLKIADEESWTDMVFEGGSINSALKEVESEDALQDVIRRRGRYPPY